MLPQPRLSESDIHQLMATQHARTPADFSRLDKLLADRLPEDTWPTAHGDDLYRAGLYLRIRGLKLGFLSDVAKAKQCFAAAFRAMTHSSRDNALLGYAETQLEDGTAAEKLDALDSLRVLASDVDATCLHAAFTLTLPHEGVSHADWQHGIAVAEEALSLWKDEIRDLEQAVREGKSMLRLDIKMQKKLAAKKVATNNREKKALAAKSTKTNKSAVKKSATQKPHAKGRATKKRLTR